MKFKWIVIIIVLLLLIFAGAYLYKNILKSNNSVNQDNIICRSDSECSEGFKCLICGQDGNGLTSSKPASNENPGKCTLGCM